MKKLFSFCMALIATLSIWAGNVITYTADEKLPETMGPWTSGLHTDAFNVAISSHTFSNGTGTITFEGDVTRIGDYAFRGCSGLTSITIPNSVTSIGDDAFYYCSSLTSITIPNSVTSIGNSAFYGCSDLTSIVVEAGNNNYDSRDNCNAIIEKSTNTLIFGCQNTIIPNSVTSIGESAFEGCSSLTSITIPNSVTSIGDYAFYECTSLKLVVNCSNLIITKGSENNGYVAYYADKVYTGVIIGDFVIKNGKILTGYLGQGGNVVIPDYVTNIGEEVFSGCSGLTSITIPNSVMSIGESAFSGCSGLTSIMWNAKNCSNPSYYEYAPFYDICSQITDFTLGEEVASVPDFLCSGMKKLSAITIPNSVTSIGTMAFSGCSGLTSITIPNSVTSIGDWAFSGCSGLTSIVWNAKNCSIPTTYQAPFYYICSQIGDFTLGEEVESVPNYLCSGMKKLSTITFPNSVKSIGSSAFSGCSGLSTITIPNSVMNIGDYAFSGCSGLTSIVVESGNNNYDSRENSDAIIEKSTNTLIAGCQNTVIPNSVTNIGNDAFLNCSGLTSITIPNSVTSIGKSAFYGCTSLKLVVNSSNINIMKGSEDNGYVAYYANKVYTGEIVGDFVIKNGKILTGYLGQGGNIVIPDYVTSIGESAFSGCSGLTSVTIPNSVMNIGDYAFYNCSGLTSVTIPSSVMSIGDRAFAYSGLTSVTIPNSVTSIGGSAFEGCSGLTSVTIPNSVTSIGEWAFRGCSSLTSVTIPNSVTSIGGSAFEGCSGLTSVTIPNSVTSIGEWAFRGCSSLTSVTIPNSVTSIGEGPFYYCYGLTSIVWNAKNCSSPSGSSAAPFFGISSQITDFTLGEEVESVPSYLCYGMNKLTSITIPNSVTSIGGSAFAYSGLTSVTIPNSVTSIGEDAFYICPGLTSITIPNSVMSIGGYAFSGCSGLTSIVWNAKNCSSPSGSSVAPFNEISSQITDFTLGEEVESVPNYLCYGMNKLTSITIPNSVKSIGSSAFKDCLAIRKVVMGSAIASIGNEAFAGCTGLIELQVNAVVPPLIDATTFNDVSRTLPVYVPGGSIDSYRAAQYWNEFNNLKAQTLPQATLTLNADSEMGAVYGAGTYDKGSDVQIFAIDNSGYEFTGWSDGNTDNPRTLRLTDNLTLTANFEKIEVAEYTINVSAINPALGTATATEMVLVEAVPYPGCTFVCWSDGNFENPRYIPLTGDINLQAIFSGTPTSVAETTDKAQGVVRKVIVDGQLHIIRDEKIYTVEGVLVE